MPKSVTFNSNGLNLAGHLYLPESTENVKSPAIIIGHQASGVKEQAPALYAEYLVKHGFVVLTFDTGTQGESEGTPRGVEDPARRVEEFKNAVSYLTTCEQVDSERIGVLGICASGGYVIPATATDHRIKAVATLSGVDLARIYRQGADDSQDPAVFQAMLQMSAQARTAEANGHDVMYFPIFESEESAKASGVFMAEGWDYYCTPRAMHPRTAKEFTVTSIDKIGFFDAFAFADMISPRPLLVIIGKTAVTANNSKQAYDNAKEPKELFWIDNASHVDLYDKQPFVGESVEKLVAFFSESL